MRQPVPFGKYLLLDRISVGGMAEVFKAKSYGVEGFEKIIAIKRILPTMGEDRDFIKMFIDEAKIAGQLAHANICQIFELGRIDGSHFIAMEYIWGKDLLQIQNRLRKLKQQMPIPMACFSIAKVLEGLDYAHRKRDPLGRPLEIVHRDCSPQNVLVSYEGEVKVIDFGIAKATSRNSRTMAGVLKGKFGYMSPEQVRGLPLDRRSDIFALGTMLYECLTGDRLFMGETDFSTLEKVRNVDIAPPRSINPDIPEAVEKVILKALAKDVDDRYQWCSEMLADLQAYLMSQDVVYTAKTLSSWLKDIFQPEIDRERAQLEQYKRIGRDGLIGGVPSAEADKDIVGQLGEAPAPEGDATTLGGPSFDDIEAAIANNAQPEVPAAAKRAVSEEDSSDFGEEAPTEIFGDGIDPSQLPAIAAMGRPATVPPPAPGAAKNPPKPPAQGRAPTMQRPQEVPVAAAGQGAQMGVRPAAQNAPMPPPQYPYGQQPYGESPQGTPNSIAAQSGLSNTGPAKTVLGMTAPIPPQGVNMTGPQPQMSGVPAMGGYPQMAAMQSGPQQMPQPYRPSGQMPAPGYPQQGGYPQQQYPSGPGPYPSTSMPGYGGANAYGQYPSGQQPVVPVEGVAPRVEGKRSTLVRDILIGVAIAALVLGGFFLFKILVLDKGNDTADTPNQPKIATVHISMSAGVSADLLVDEKKVATVIDGQDIPVSAGMRHVVLAGPGGGKCEVNVKLEAGKTTPLKCQLEQAKPATPQVTTDGSAAMATPAAGSGAGSAAGSASTGSAAMGSAAMGSAATGSATGSAGSAAAPMTGSGTGSSTTTATGSAAAIPDKTTASTNTTKASASTATAAVTTNEKTVAHDQKATAASTSTTTKSTSSNSSAAKQTMPETSAKTSSADTSGKGYLVITSKPMAKILVDGADTGLSTPISGKSLALAPGKHKITFVMGDDRYTFPVTISAGKTERLDKDLQ